MTNGKRDFFLCYRLGLSSSRALYALAGSMVPLLACLMVSCIPYPNLLFLWLYRLYPALLDAIIIVQPETVIRWH